MFGKLLKHDFIATGKIMGIIYAVFAGVALYLVGSVAISGNELDSIPEMLSYILLCLTAFANFIMTAVVVMRNFQTSLYGDQGYLTFTLPVKSSSILFSKTFVSIFWYLAAFGTLYLTAMIALWAMGEMMGDEGLGLIDMLLSMVQEGLSVTVVIIYAIAEFIKFFFLVVAVTMTAFFAITVSNTRPFQKHYALFTMLFLTVTDIVVLKFTDIVTEYIHIGFNYNYITGKVKFATGAAARDAFVHVDLVEPVLLVVICVGLFIGTHMLMKKKINLR